MLCLSSQRATSVLLNHPTSIGEEKQHRDSTSALSLQDTQQSLSVLAARRWLHAGSWTSRSAVPVSCRSRQQHDGTFMAVMSMTCHFMRGRARRFRRSMAVTTDLYKIDVGDVLDCHRRTCSRSDPLHQRKNVLIGTSCPSCHGGIVVHQVCCTVNKIRMQAERLLVAMIEQTGTAQVQHSLSVSVSRSTAACKLPEERFD